MTPRRKRARKARVMTDHTPIPWGAATAYSSIVGVPIIGWKGQRVGNTALPGLPAEWAEMKERALADAAFIVKAANNHDALVEALKLARARIEYLGAACNDPKHFMHNAEVVLPKIDAVLTQTQDQR